MNNDDQSYILAGYRSVVCATCTMTFYLPARFVTQRMKDGLSFNCPCGHGNSYYVPKPGDPEDLKRRVEALEKENRDLKVEKAQLLHRMDQMNVS